MIVFPLGYSSVDGCVEDEWVETNQQEQHKLYPEGRVEIALGGLGPEEEEAAAEHDDEAHPCKRKHGTGKARHRDFAQDDSKHAEVEDGDGPHQQRDEQDMHRLDHRERIVGFADRGADLRIVEELTKMLEKRLFHKRFDLREGLAEAAGFS